MTQPIWGPPELPIVTATREQLARLEAAGILTDDHAILKAAILSLANTMAAAERKGASVGLAHISKELREWFALLPQPPAPDDEFTAFMRELGGVR